MFEPLMMQMLVRTAFLRLKRLGEDMVGWYVE